MLIRRLVMVAMVAWGVSAVYAAQPERPLPIGHAHNDYLHDRPLFDALDHDFASVEADLNLVDGQLLVAHSHWDVEPDRTLESLYLAPLKQRIEENGGKVYPWLDQFILLVDFKTDGESTYQALKPVLEKYRSMLTSVNEGEVTPGPVIVILSGSYPFETVAAEASRLVAIDGRPYHLNRGYPVNLIPIISEDWHDQFTWTGRRIMPVEQRRELRNFVRQVHEEGRKLRFWGTPHRADFWDELSAAGVDLLGADRLEQLQGYLEQLKAKQSSNNDSATPQPTRSGD